MKSPEKELILWGKISRQAADLWCSHHSTTVRKRLTTLPSVSQQTRQKLLNDNNVFVWRMAQENLPLPRKVQAEIMKRHYWVSKATLARNPSCESDFLYGIVRNGGEFGTHCAVNNPNLPQELLEFFEKDNILHFALIANQGVPIPFLCELQKFSDWKWAWEKQYKRILRHGNRIVPFLPFEMFKSFFMLAGKKKDKLEAKKCRDCLILNRPTLGAEIKNEFETEQYPDYELIAWYLAGAAFLKDLREIAKFKQFFSEWIQNQSARKQDMVTKIINDISEEYRSMLLPESPNEKWNVIRSRSIEKKYMLARLGNLTTEMAVALVQDKNEKIRSAMYRDQMRCELAPWLMKETSTKMVVAVLDGIIERCKYLQEELNGEVNLS